MLEDQDHHQHENRQQQIFHGAEVLGGIAAAKGVDAHGDQAQTDGHDHGAGDHRGEEFPQRLQEEAQHAFKQAADDGGAHNRAIGQHTAAHGGGNAVEHPDEAGGSTHDDGHSAADGAHGEQLYQRDNARHQHGVLQQVQLQAGEFTPGKAAGAGDDQQGGQIAHEHGQHMLQSQGNCLLQRHFAIQLEGGFGQTVGCFHEETSLSLSAHSISSQASNVNYGKGKYADRVCAAKAEFTALARHRPWLSLWESWQPSG